jgi:sorbitol/mannitol transport system substrate-binding protein
MWIDWTYSAGPPYDKTLSQVAFANSPNSVAPNGSQFLWSWVFAIPQKAKTPEAAQKFAEWATSKDYIKMVAEDVGWPAVPPGTRKSTYDNPAYQKAAPFTQLTLNAMQTADPTHPSAKPVPYTGIQFVGIPEFQSFGTMVGQNIAGHDVGRPSAQRQPSRDRACHEASRLLEVAWIDILELEINSAVLENRIPRANAWTEERDAPPVSLCREPKDRVRLLFPRL